MVQTHPALGLPRAGHGFGGFGHISVEPSFALSLPLHALRQVFCKPEVGLRKHFLQTCMLGPGQADLAEMGRKQTIAGRFRPHHLMAMAML